MFAERVTPFGQTEATTPARMLVPISRAKYPAVTPQEEGCSLALQCLHLALFDAVLVHLMNTLAPDSWQEIRDEICARLISGKDEASAAILAQHFEENDVICLQECARSYSELLRSGPLGKHFHVVNGVAESTRDQDSLILLRKATFPEPGVDVTAAVLAHMSGGAADGESRVQPGDLLTILAVDALGRKYLLASFHGDSNGLVSMPLVDAISNFARKEYPTHCMVLGMDANTHHGDADGRESVTRFAAGLKDLGLATSWGEHPSSTLTTTYLGRTYVQPQLQKVRLPPLPACAGPSTSAPASRQACRRADIKVKGDSNLKDWVIFRPGEFQLARSTIDNTGWGEFKEDTLLPTLTFPSDHAAVRVTLHAK